MNAYVRRLAPGGNVTVHFNQLVVADVITIRQYTVLILCEVDVLGTKVILSPEGQHLNYDASNFIDNIPVSFLCRPFFQGTPVVRSYDLTYT